ARGHAGRLDRRQRPDSQPALQIGDLSVGQGIVADGHVEILVQARPELGIRRGPSKDFVKGVFRHSSHLLSIYLGPVCAFVARLAVLFDTGLELAPGFALGRSSRKSIATGSGRGLQTPQWIASSTARP